MPNQADNRSERFFDAQGQPISLREQQTLIALAPAKLNLSLRILRRRDDGFHELESVFAGVSLYDTLVATRRDDDAVNLRVHGGASDITAGTDNLVVRAADKLRALSGCSLGVDFTLVKRIPSQAGLGGGSSDAAAALVLLNRLWGLDLSDEALGSVAASLGSDLNFFLADSVVALARGRGEHIVPLQSHASFDVVVVHPSFGASTKAVFEHLNVRPKESLSIEQHQSSIVPMISGRVTGENDLLPALELSERRFRDWFERLRRATHGATTWTLTGSGTAVYGFVRSRRAGLRLAARVRSLFPEATAFSVGAGKLRLTSLR